MDASWFGVSSDASQWLWSHGIRKIIAVIVFLVTLPVTVAILTLAFVLNVIAAVRNI